MIGDLLFLVALLAAVALVLVPFVAALARIDQIGAWLVGVLGDVCDLVAYLWRGRAFDERQVRAQLEAESRIEGAHRQARRAMNEAADQAWRNLAG